MSHTPGPWDYHIADAATVSHIAIDADDQRLADVYSDVEDALLIAAAPDLLAALEACEENMRLIHDAAGEVPHDAPMPKHTTFSAWLLATQAIAKARP